MSYCITEEHLKQALKDCFTAGYESPSELMEQEVQRIYTALTSNPEACSSGFKLGGGKPSEQVLKTMEILAEVFRKRPQEASRPPETAAVARRASATVVPMPAEQLQPAPPNNAFAMNDAAEAQALMDAIGAEVQEGQDGEI